MNIFDIVVCLASVVAIVTGFKAGLLRSAVTILAYVIAMPVAAWMMSLVSTSGGKFASPVARTRHCCSGFF
jgi:membrane protein required for colicin V production